jgi:hypothetical protein
MTEIPKEIENMVFSENSIISDYHEFARVQDKRFDMGLVTAEQYAVMMYRRLRDSWNAEIESGGPVAWIGIEFHLVKKKANSHWIQAWLQKLYEEFVRKNWVDGKMPEIDTSISVIEEGEK